MPQYFNPKSGNPVYFDPKTGKQIESEPYDNPFLNAKPQQSSDYLDENGNPIQVKLPNNINSAEPPKTAQDASGTTNDAGWQSDPATGPSVRPSVSSTEMRPSSGVFDPALDAISNIPARLVDFGKSIINSSPMQQMSNENINTLRNAPSPDYEFHPGDLLNKMLNPFGGFDNPNAPVASAGDTFDSVLPVRPMIKDISEGDYLGAAGNAAMMAPLLFGGLRGMAESPKPVINELGPRNLMLEDLMGEEFNKVGGRGSREGIDMVTPGMRSADALPQGSLTNRGPMVSGEVPSSLGPQDLPKSAGELAKQTGKVAVNPATPITAPSRLREIWNLPKGLLSVDLPYITSAAFRQGRRSILVSPTNWAKAWIPSVKSYGSSVVFNAHKESLIGRSLFKDMLYGTAKNPKSLADVIGLKLVDGRNFSRMEENIRSSMAEKVPVWGKGVAASNRSYAAYLNDLRVNIAEDLIHDAKAKGLDPIKDKMYFKGIGDFVNTLTGAGDLNIKLIGNKGINLEPMAGLMNDVLFAPRNLSSNLKFFNPNTYITAPKGLRMQYVKGLLSTLGTWGTVSALAKFGGADVNMNPTSADFGKIKIGDLRIDPGGGGQQVVVALSRLMSGQFTSSTNDKTSGFGSSYNAPTGGSIVGNYAINQLSPNARFVYDILNASEQKPVNLADRVTQQAIPLVLQDMNEVIQEDPNLAWLLPFFALSASSGLSGVQRYGKGVDPSLQPSKLLPDVVNPSIQGFPWNWRMGGS